MLIEKLQTQKNLLAFSGGVDSTSLFFILLENGIPFDMAIVDYNQREQSKQEVAYAFELAKKYNKKCYLKEYPKDCFSEKDARDFRYDFFDEIILENGYETLITAHQLNDKLEWFMMQLSKGAGLYELIGLETYSKRKNYNLFRPLLEYSKKELEEYLKSNNHRYFIDKSNSDTKYKRNHIRKYFADDFIDQFQEGVKKSFEYLQNDMDSLKKQYRYVQFEDLILASFSGDDFNLQIRFIDHILKKNSILLSKNSRDEIHKTKECVISHKIAIAIKNNKVFIAPYIVKTMDKKFKEWCRIKKIPKHIRAYMSSLDFEMLQDFIDSNSL